MCGPDRSCNHLIEDGGLQLNREELRIVREQRGVQVMLDRGKVDFIVFRARMVSGHHDAKGGQQQQNRGVPKQRIVFQGLGT